ncbi:MAG: hypothetical protein ACPGVY_14735, partial [Mycobacterium sp.]
TAVAIAEHLVFGADIRTVMLDARIDRTEAARAGRDSLPSCGLDIASSAHQMISTERTWSSANSGSRR